MNPTKPKRSDVSILDQYEENRANFPLEELAKYAGQYIAFSLDGTRILANGLTEDEVDEKLSAAGIPLNQVVNSFIDPPGAGKL